MDYLTLARLAVETSQKIGIHAAEAYVLDAKSLTIEVANQKIETLKQARDRGIGLRIISKQGTIGFAYSTNLEADKLNGLAKQALDNSRKTFADIANQLPEKHTVLLMNLLDEQISATSLEDKIAMAKAVEVAAQVDGRVKRSERCAYEDSEYGVALANSQGLAASYRAGYCGLYGMVLAEAGNDVQSGMALNYSRNISRLNPEAVGKEAAEDASRLLGAKSIGTTRAELVLSPYIATNFFSTFVPALTADAVQKGRSLFKNKLGEKVVSPLVSLIDDGRLDGGVATAPMDGEGMPTSRTELIINGVLNSYLYNTYTAVKDGVQSTGNGVRSSFSSLPEIGPTNLFIKPGSISADKLISQVKNGFYVTNVMGMHTANPISGDFSVGASGMWIQNGQFTHSVRGVAIAGNILELFRQVDAVADDLRFFGAQGSPTIRISGITVSGA